MMKLCWHGRQFVGQEEVDDLLSRHTSGSASVQEQSARNCMRGFRRVMKDG
jgi:hypothetical protein